MLYITVRFLYLTRANIGTIKEFKRYVYCIPTRIYTYIIYTYIYKLYTVGNVVGNYQGEPYLVYARRSNEQGFRTRRRFEQLFQGVRIQRYLNRPTIRRRKIFSLGCSFVIVYCRWKTNDSFDK